MQSIYQAADAIDAQRIVALLEDHGIPAHVQGAYLAGAIGELPAGGLVSVWVADDDAARARQLVVDEEADRLARQEADEADVEDDDASASAAAASAKASGGVLVPALFAFLFGTVVGGGIMYGQLRTPQESLPIDYDGDGVADQYYDVEGETLVRVRFDRDGDGEIDQVQEDASEPDNILRVDDDFDGRFETIYRYAKQLPVQAQSDLDGDGFMEWNVTFRHGVARTATLRDPTTDALLKRETFDGGLLVLEEFDADGDGTLETVRHIDLRGERVDAPGR